MFWRRVLAAESCNPKHDFSHTCSSQSPPTPTLHTQKAPTRPLPRTYTTKPFKEPWNLGIWSCILVEKRRSFNVTCYLHRHTFTVISLLHARPYFTREQSLRHFPSARLTSGTSMCHESVCEPKETISSNMVCRKLTPAALHWTTSEFRFTAYWNNGQRCNACLHAERPGLKWS
jgi:hypothetical protein